MKLLKFLIPFITLLSAFSCMDMAQEPDFDPNDSYTFLTLEFSGAVVNESGLPLSDVEISIVGHKNSQPVYTTPQDGSFFFVEEAVWLSGTKPPYTFYLKLHDKRGRYDDLMEPIQLSLVVGNIGLISDRIITLR